MGGWEVCKEPWKPASTPQEIFTVCEPLLSALQLVPRSETGCLTILTSSPLGVNPGSLTSHVQDQYLNFPSQTHSSPKSMNQHHH